MCSRDLDDEYVAWAGFVLSQGAREARVRMAGIVRNGMPAGFGGSNKLSWLAKGQFHRSPMRQNFDGAVIITITDPGLQ